MNSKRLFLAIDLPASIKRCLAALFEHGLEGARWKPMENLHLTLRFIGDVEEEGEERLLEELSKVQVSRFTLSLEGSGVFPPKGEPRVAWIGVGSGHPLLFQLRQQVDDAILRAGIECEMRDFAPHITLARLSGVSVDSLRNLLKPAKQGYMGPAFSAREFTLFESRPAPDGSRYFPVEAFPLS